MKFKTTRKLFNKLKSFKQQNNREENNASDKITGEKNDPLLEMINCYHNLTKR